MYNWKIMSSFIIFHSRSKASFNKSKALLFNFKIMSDYIKSFTAY